MKSIRSALLGSLLGGMALLVALSYAGIYAYVARALRGQQDAELLRKVRAFALMGEREDAPDPLERDAPYEDHGDDTDDAVRFEFAELTLPEFQPSAAPEYYQVWDAAGQVLARSPSLAGANLPLPSPQDSAILLQDILLPDTRPGRLAAMSLVPSAGGQLPTTDEAAPLTLALARSTEDLRETLAVLLAGLVGAGLATLGLASGLIWGAVNRGLRPLDAMGREIASLDAESLAHRIGIPANAAELRPVATRLNDLLARLEEAFARERRFTSNVAHELRTPVAELRALAEVSLRREHSTAADRHSFEDAAAIAQGMDRVIATLLEIARCESGQRTRELRRTDLSALVQEAWTPFGEAASSKRLQVDLGINGARPISTDPVMLSTVLGNLFSNAVEYTPDGGRVVLRVADEDSRVVIALSNNTRDLVEDDLAHLFEMFWRKEGAMADSGHAGIGLSLVAALCGALGAEVQRELLPGPMLRISLRLPASPRG